jgi:hypothetical protein
MSADLLHKIGEASRTMAEVALAMQLSADKVSRAAQAYTEAAEALDAIGLPSKTYHDIAAIFREMGKQNSDFSALINMCLDVSEVCG